MDLLTYSIERMNIQGQLICQAVGGAPWGLKVDSDLHVPFYFIQSGSAWIDLYHGSPTRLHQGDLVFLPHGCAHSLFDHIQSPTIPLIQWLTPLTKPRICPKRFWQGGVESHIMCGVYRLDYSLFTEMILKKIPKKIILSSNNPKTRTLIWSTLQFLLDELEQNQMGGYRVITQVLDLLLIKATRAWMERQPQEKLGWLNAAKDPHISQAVATLIQSPEVSWTVASIAEEVGLSRASFAREFQNITGQPPLTFLTEYRLNFAAQLLTLEWDSISEIGARVGYRSEAAFTRAFKRQFGVPPSHYRMKGNRTEITNIFVRSMLSN